MLMKENTLALKCRRKQAKYSSYTRTCTGTAYFCFGFNMFPLSPARLRDAVHHASSNHSGVGKGFSACVFLSPTIIRASYFYCMHRYKWAKACCLTRVLQKLTFRSSFKSGRVALVIPPPKNKWAHRCVLLGTPGVKANVSFFF